MPTLRLTQLTVEGLRPPTDKAAIYWDTTFAGFGVRISPRGKRVWVCQYRVRNGRTVNGKPAALEVLETLGPLTELTLKQARDLARQSMAKARRGIHPVKEREQQEAAANAEKAGGALTFAVLADRYLKAAEPNVKPSTHKEIGRLLGKTAQFFGDRPVHEIRKADILALIGQRRPNGGKAGGLVSVNNTLAATRRAFRWAVKRDLLMATAAAQAFPAAWEVLLAAEVAGPSIRVRTRSWSPVSGPETARL